MIINRNAFAKALWPGVNAWFGEGYGELPLQLTNLFDQHTSDKAFEEDVSVVGFGMFSQTSEGNPVQFDDMQQGFITRYQHLKYTSGFIITQEMVDDDQYMQVASRKAPALGFAARQTQETVAANLYNRAFNSTYKGGDAKELLATDHPNASGGTFSNELTTAADLSEASLEQAVIDIHNFTNDRGLKIAVQIKCLIIPVQLWAEADRILKSPLQYNTADNSINALKMAGSIPVVYMNNYLTDSDAWFLRTNVPHGLKRWVRKPITFSEDNDFHTDNLLYKAVYRESYGWSDAHGLFGSPGA